MADINSKKQNIISNLNDIINYNYNSESFDVLKGDLMKLLNQLLLQKTKFHMTITKKIISLPFLILM